ncbi:hypothetical protein DFH06DRAFT_459345 [Mycena polygramma]|nr:hypothetical protein DFH06DRAFT_459345 [Mycena polygramma]
MLLNRIAVLREFDGLVKSGELLVVLSRRGIGCSTFLKTIAGALLFSHSILLGEVRRVPLTHSPSLPLSLSSMCIQGSQRRAPLYFTGYSSSSTRLSSRLAALPLPFVYTATVHSLPHLTHPVLWIFSASTSVSLHGS